MDPTRSRRPEHCRPSRRRFLGCARGPRPRRPLLEGLEVRTLLAAGDLDTSFGSGGLVTTNMMGTFSYDLVYDMVEVGTEGKMVVVGSAGGSLALVRYLADGTLDPAFAGGGKTAVTLPGGSARAQAVVLQDDGRLVVAGVYDPSGSTPANFLVARFTSDGVLDPTFDGDGWTATDFGSTTDGAWGVAIDGEGRIVAGGFAYATVATADFALARYLNDGRLDTSFGGDGRVTTDFTASSDFGMALTLDAAGRIVVAGYSQVPDTAIHDFAVARYSDDGTLDSAFSEDGWATVDFGPDGYLGPDYATGVAVDADGRLLLGGYSSQPHEGDQFHSDFALARLTSAGALDATFGAAGKVITDVADSADYCHDLAVAPDGRILLVGYAAYPATEVSDFALVRYTADGVLDGTFGPDGRVVTDFGSGSEQGRSVLVTDDKIVVAGVSSQPATGQDFAVLRYLGTGPARAPRVMSHTATGDAYGPVSALQLIFDQAMDQTSLVLADDVSPLQGPGGAVPVTGYQWQAANRLELSFAPQSLPGDYQLAIGPQILNLAGSAMDQDRDGTAGESVEDQYTAGFTVLPIPPRVVSHAPTGIVPAPIGTLRLDFDQAMDHGTFLAGDDVLSFDGPDGPLTVAESVWLDDDTLELRFTPQRTPGDYELVLGTEVLSTYQAALDQDGDRVAGETGADWYRAAFTVDQPAEVVNQRPEGVLLGPVSWLQLDFSRPMDAASFVPADDVLSFSGPSGPLTVSNWSWLDADTLELSFAAVQAPGTYQLALGPDLRTPAGSLLDQDGDLLAGEDPEDRYTAEFTIVSAPYVLGQTPTGITLAPVSTLRVDFDQAMNPASFAVADDAVSFTGPGGSLTVSDSAWLDADTLELPFTPQRTPGNYELILGPGIFSVPNFALDQDRDQTPGEPVEDRYSARFTIDQPPRVVAQRPAGATVGPVSPLQLDFNRPMDPASFLPAADVLSFSGPGGTLAVSGFRWIDADTLELSFAELRAPGAYQLVIGPNVSTPAGSRLDQDNDLVAGEDPEDRYTATFEITSGPWIVSHTPSGDQVQPVSEVRVTFDVPIKSSTFLQQDVSILGPAGPVAVSEDPQLVSGNQYRINFAQQTAYGTYHVYVGPNIANAAGVVMDQDRDGIAGEPWEDRYDASFTLLDVTGPRVTGHAPALPINTALSYVDLTFNEAIASSSFNPADATLTGPAGRILVGDVQPLAADRFRVSFPPQSAEGTYRLTVGPAITDTAGNLMDQDADGDKGEAGDDQYAAVVQIDLTPPAVAGHSLAGVQYVPVTSFELTFTEAMAGATFGKQDVAVTGPSGSVTVTSVTQLAADRFRIVLPATVRDGTFTVAIAPVVADLAGNPLPAPGYQFQFVQQLPDLRVSRSVVPAECLGGQEIDVAWTVTNTGQGTALGAWWDTVYLSTDNQAGGDPQLVRLRYESGPNGLAAGASYTRTATVTIPSEASGSRWIIVTTDQQTEVTEQVETNNTTVGSPALWVTTRPYPDLQVAEVTIPATLPADETAGISWTVRNLGTGPTSIRVWFDAVYLSTDSVWDAADRKLLEVRNPEFLGAGEYYVQTADVPIPPDVARDRFFLLVQTDSGDTEEEFDREGNNFAASPGTADVITPAPGFLEVVSIDGPDTAVPGSVIDFTWVIRNTGGAKIYPRSDIGYWDDAAALSRDATFSQDDYWLGGHLTHHSQPLLPGQTLACQIDHSRPAALPDWAPGDYYLILVPDNHYIALTQGTVAGRSVAVTPITLAYAYPPDLATTNVVAPAAAESGQRAEFGWTVANQGTGTTNWKQWRDDVYLSADQTLGAEDIRIGQYTFHGELGPENGPATPDDESQHGGNVGPIPPISYTATASFRIPNGLSGDWYVIVKADADASIHDANPANNVAASDVAVPITLIQSDLQPTVDVAPLTGRAGQTIQVAWTVHNRGASPTAVGAWEDAWYLSHDDTFQSGVDRWLKSVSYTGGVLEGGASYQRTTSLSLPRATEGTYYLFLVTDAGNGLYEHQGEGNNVVGPAQPLVIQDPAADLEVLDFTVAAGPYIAGRAVTLTRHVRNSGTEAVAKAWQDALYLSADAVFDAKQDRRISTFPQTPPLAVGGEYGNPTTVTLPDGVAGSYYYFFYVADVQSDIYEKKAEANNLASFGPVDVVDLKPDLVVESASSQTAGTAGQFLDVYFTIANRGEEPARGPWWDALYLSANEVFDPAPTGEADSLFAVFKHSGDAAVDELYGPSATPAAVRLPDRVEGRYRIFLVPNYNQSIDELDRSDAYLLPDPVQITYLPPDLQVSTVTAPAAATSGTPIQVAWMVRNEGVQRTAEASWQDGVYLSTDAVFDPLGDLELGVVPHTGVLEPGEAYSASAWYTLRQDLEGPYHVYVATDVRRQVYEHNREDNNATEAPTLLDVAGVHADLQAAAGVLPATVPMGDSVQVQWTVTNAGRDATAALGWSDAIYLSVDAVLDAGDRRLASLPHDGVLESQASYQRAVNAAIPADAPGDYYLLVKTDSAARNDVYEFQAEDNNVAAVTIQVTYAPTPDLQVAEIVAPAEAWSAQNLHLEWTVRNAGAAAASSTQGGWFDSVYLSRDPYVDRNADLYLGAVEYRGTLAAGAAYPLRQSLDAKLPVGISGPYYALAVTDSNNRIFERAAEDNNIRAAAGTLQVNLTPPADLQVTGITVPAPAIYGEPANWTYEVTNQDTLDAYGAWVDTIYLSEDNAWDLSDPRIGRVYHDGDVPHAASYSETLTAPVPGLVPGEYYVIVRTDILDQLREIDETNNTGVSETKFQVLGRQLEMGVPAAGMLGPQQTVYYELPVGYLQDVRITVSGQAAATAELYVAGWSLPTRGAYDARSAGSATQNPQVRLSETSPGMRYILVYGRQTSGTLPFEITAELLEAAVTAVTPNVGSNTGMVTVYVAGQNLPLEPAVELVSPSGEAIPAVEVTEASQTGFYAQFGLYSAAPGLYDLRISAEGVAEILAEDAVTVVEGGRGQLETRLIVPALVRLGAPFSISVEYANVGTADLVSPLLHVTGPAKIQFGLAPGEYVSKGSIQFLAYSSTGPAGVLQPGDREVLTFHCSGLIGDTFDFELTAIEVNPEDANVEIIDWPSLETEYRPVFSTAEEWAPHWQVFTREIGCTWPEVVAFLARLFTENPSQSFLGSDLMQHAFEVLTLAGGLTGGGGLTDFDPPYVMSDMEVVPATRVVTGVDLIFSEIIDGTTLTADTLRIVDPDGNAIEATAIEARSDRLWRVSFAPQTARGVYHIYVGPNVTDTVGQALDLDRDGKMGEAGDDVYDAQFRIGENTPAVRQAEAELARALAAAEGDPAAAQQNAPPPPGTYIKGHTPNTAKDLRDGFHEVRVHFSEPIRWVTFSSRDVTITGPDNVPIKAYSVTRESSTTALIKFPELTKDGTYRFAIDSEIQDRQLRYLDQNQNGIPGEAGDRYLFQIEGPDTTGPWIDQNSLRDLEMPGLSEFTVHFNEPMDPATVTPNRIALIGPKGEVSVTGVAATPDNLSFRVRFPPQGDAGPYIVTVSPEVTDAAGNGLNTNRNASNGEWLLDVWSRVFWMSAERIVVQGRIFYTQEIARGLGDAAHLTVQLWDANGVIDADPGRPTAGDEADTLVATHNVLNGYAAGSQYEGVTDNDGNYRFLFDKNGNPIINVDYGTGPNDINSQPDFYIALLGKNEYAHVVKESTLKKTSRLEGETAVQLTEGGWFSDPWWGRYYFTVPSSTFSPDALVGEFARETLTTNVPIPPSDYLPLDWIRYGARWLENALGYRPRSAINVIHPLTVNNFGLAPDPDKAAHIGSGNDIILLGSRVVPDMLSVLHEYGHSLQYAMNGYKDHAYEKDAYGMISVSKTKSAPFAEAWASFFAAKSVESIYAAIEPTMTDVGRNRSNPRFLENNDYWRGWSAYGYREDDSLADLDEGVNNVTIWPQRYPRFAVHHTGHEGERVMGAVMSIFWDISDGLGDDQVDNDIRGMFAAVQAAAGESTFASFSANYRTAANQRAFDAICVDHGVPVAPDRLEEPGYGGLQNDFSEVPTAFVTSTPFEESDLVMDETAWAAGDWYRITLPATAGAGNAKPYNITVGIEFNLRYGDLDLFVRLFEDGNSIPILVDSRTEVGTGLNGYIQAYERDGAFPAVSIRDNITLPNLRNDKRYNLQVGVAGHGTLSRVGNEIVGTAYGDMHPRYSLFFEGQVPAPPKTDNVKDAATLRTNRGRDPNDKVTTGGYGESLYVPADALLPYTIHFENVADATASVVLVKVTDQLDADLDWSTFELGDMEFGHHLVDVPPGLNYFESRIDLRPEGNNLLVDVVAELNPATGLVTWTFTAIDPATGEFTYDPLAGFLPPNTENHDGEGFVSYTVRPKADLPSGTEISNAATIIFDWNEPIDTPLVVNVIDSGPPQSAVQTLATQVDEEHFLVRWDGADDESGAGVHSYDVYVSDNGGPFARWLSRTTSLSAAYAGQFEHSYAFYTVAVDNTGHLEAAPATADATTLLALYRWHHYANPYDVNAQDGVWPQDVLLIINWINAHPGSSDLPAAPVAPPPYYDVTKDNRCTAQDVLLVINFINSHLAGGASEAESAEAVPGLAEAQFAWPAWTAEPAYRLGAIEPRATPLADWLPRTCDILQDACCKAVPAAGSPLSVPLLRSLKTGPQADPVQTDLAFAELGDLLFDLVPLPGYC